MDIHARILEVFADQRARGFEPTSVQLNAVHRTLLAGQLSRGLQPNERVLPENLKEIAGVGIIPEAHGPSVVNASRSGQPDGRDMIDYVLLVAEPKEQSAIPRR